MVSSRAYTRLAPRRTLGKIVAAGNRLAHVLMYAELVCAVCNGPMRGRHHTYRPFDTVVPTTAGPAAEQAITELARRYFVSRGPATLRDFVWWSGLTAADCRGAIIAYQDLRIAPLRPGVLDPPWDRLVLIDGLAVGRWRRELGRRAVRVEIALVEELSKARMNKLDNEIQRFARFVGLEPDVTVAYL